MLQARAGIATALMVQDVERLLTGVGSGIAEASRRKENELFPTQCRPH